ncbi:MAG: prepilin-type N-terminal cleavage/methylation domain-containing protein [Chitinivibrionia bacterium]|nr:prepilin-type N-terminal cleavage/methylation domain-containing protein [Chitinivibrionia bacterium]
MHSNVKKNNGGFTLVELMIVITIIMILSTTVTLSISNFVLERRGEVQVVAFYNQLKTMRTFAQRDDAMYVLRFTNNAAAAGTPMPFTITRHRPSPTVPPIPEAVDGVAVPNLFSDQAVVSGALRASALTTATLTTPNGNIVAVTAWAEGIVFQNDEIGTIGQGAVFLRNPNINDINYVIVRPARINEIQLWRQRGGGAWTQL